MLRSVVIPTINWIYISLHILRNIIVIILFLIVDYKQHLERK